MCEVGESVEVGIDAMEVCDGGWETMRNHGEIGIKVME
jgi:hypothetical protein